MRQGLPGISASVDDFTLREEAVNESHYQSGKAARERVETMDVFVPAGGRMWTSEQSMLSRQSTSVRIKLFKSMIYEPALSASVSFSIFVFSLYQSFTPLHQSASLITYRVHVSEHLTKINIFPSIDWSRHTQCVYVHSDIFTFRGKKHTTMHAPPTCIDVVNIISNWCPVTSLSGHWPMTWPLPATNNVYLSCSTWFLWQFIPLFLSPCLLCN